MFFFQISASGGPPFCGTGAKDLGLPEKCVHDIKLETQNTRVGVKKEERVLALCDRGV